MSKVDDILKAGAAGEDEFAAFDDIDFDAVEERNNEATKLQDAEAAALSDDGDCEGCKI